MTVARRVHYTRTDKVRASLNSAKSDTVVAVASALGAIEPRAKMDDVVPLMERISNALSSWFVYNPATF